MNPNKPNQKMRLTNEEKEWMKRLQAVLSDRPSNRLGFFTVGDASLYVYDKTKEADISRHIDEAPKGMDFSKAVDAVGGGVVRILVFPSEVHSVAG
ncbi:hypothetical protein [Acetobacter persici]|uniref:Uncharacterized protein n=1 Tax=Acetobacter persici TaxID=1076596 RepID=A0A1U9LIU4_9PROT|nr:hypothetical protein [Acetobacter persici]AQT06279.1 hypothetical protein A0U91_14730 [Acetobacter persici]